MKAPMTDTPAYQVLARKYRPETFADLVGQDAMVQILEKLMYELSCPSIYDDGYSRHG